MQPWFKVGNLPSRKSGFTNMPRIKVSASCLGISSNSPAFQIVIVNLLLMEKGNVILDLSFDFALEIITNCEILEEKKRFVLVNLLLKL